jgi:hypothetical protein
MQYLIVSRRITVPVLSSGECKRENRGWQLEQRAESTGLIHIQNSFSFFRRRAGAGGKPGDGGA